jgi:hypothetical protein
MNLVTHRARTSGKYEDRRGTLSAPSRVLRESSVIPQGLVVSELRGALVHLLVDPDLLDGHELGRVVLAAVT